MEGERRAVDATDCKKRQTAKELAGNYTQRLAGNYTWRHPMHG